MAYDKMILSTVLRQLEQSRVRHESEAELRRMELYRLFPRLQEIERELRGTSARAVRTALSAGTDPEQAIYALRDKSLALQDERSTILRKNGYPADYLKPHIDCPLCRDTGYADGKLCSCVRQKYADEQTRRLSTILPIDTDRFEAFDLNYYSNIPSDKFKQSPRYIMGYNYKVCRLYAETFSPDSGNLLMFGSTGLGKTFLSSCIARTVSERGFSVAYDTSSHVFSNFESVRFRGADSEQAAAAIQKYQSADLLILDDLGAEMVTAFTVSALYDLLNDRLMLHRPMIISTNLLPEDLDGRYSPAIASRIRGGFKSLQFIGEDIRRIKLRESSGSFPPMSR